MKGIMKRVLSLALLGTMLFGYACSPSESSSGQENPSLNAESVVYNYDSGINYDGRCLSFIDEGKTEYSILVPDNAEMRVMKAANEIKDYAVQVTGASLKIIKESSYQAGDKVISLGDTSAFKATGLDVSGLKSDGYIIKTVGDNIFINANMARGVEYGGYAFLERFFGIFSFFS